MNAGVERQTRDAFGHERRAVGIVAGHAIRQLAEQRGMESKPAIERRGVRIDQQLGGVESLPVAGIVRAVRTQPVTGAGTDIGDEAVEHVAAAFGQCDALDLRLPGPVEQAKLDGRGVRGVHGDIGAAGNEREAERLGRSGTDAAHLQDGALATRSRYSVA